MPLPLSFLAALGCNSISSGRFTSTTLWRVLGIGQRELIRSGYTADSSGLFFVEESHG